MKLIRCAHEKRHPNCKFRDEFGRCYILNATTFRDMKCPFYKVKKKGETYDPNKVYDYKG